MMPILQGFASKLRTLCLEEVSTVRGTDLLQVQTLTFEGKAIRSSAVHQIYQTVVKF